MFSPPLLIIAVRRPTIVRNPSASRSARSPVRSQPSSVKAARFAAGSFQ
jgi:hypothetical protein